MKVIVILLAILAVVFMTACAQNGNQTRDQLVANADKLVKRANMVIEKLKKENKTKDWRHVQHETDDITAMAKELASTTNENNASKQKRLEKKLTEELHQFSLELDKFEKPRNKRQTSTKEALLARAEQLSKKAMPEIAKLKAMNKVQLAERIEDRAEDIAEIAKKLNRTDNSNTELLKKLEDELKEHETKLNHDLAQIAGSKPASTTQKPKK